MTVEELTARIVKAILDPLAALFFAAGFLVFAWGVVEFLGGLSTGSESKDQGRRHMLWGVFGMAIMIGAYGIFTLVQNTVRGF